MLKNLQVALYTIGHKRKHSNKIIRIHHGKYYEKLILKEELSTNENEHDTGGNKLHNRKNSAIHYEDETIMYTSLISCVKEHQKIIS